MVWNWQIPDWPGFRYDAATLAPFEQRFLLSSGEILGAVHHVSPSERDQLRIDLLSDEAMKTSAIEGEMLDRKSVQSSLRRQLGLAPDNYPNKPREQGVAEMMVDVYSSYAEPLTHETLFRWHRMLLSYDRRLEVIGAYRQHEDAMQEFDITSLVAVFDLLLHAGRSGPTSINGEKQRLTSDARVFAVK